MAVLAAAIWLYDRGPALFTQVRVGKDGHAFRIYKFRTMVVDAEQRKVQLLASNDSDGVLFKLRRDPRVTAVGAHLRRWSIDELPQLFNVFLGHMSLVGPRPALPDEAAKYADHVRRRLVVKPGLTGLVAGQRAVGSVLGRIGPARPAVRGELVVRPDLQIMWKTISVILRGAGASNAVISEQALGVPAFESPKTGGSVVAAHDAATLVRTAATGDHRAWQGLIEKYGRLVWSITRDFKLIDSDAAERGPDDLDAADRAYRPHRAFRPGGFLARGNGAE